MSNANVQEITQQNFEQEVLRQGGPVLVDIYSDGCQPCRMLTPTMEKLASEFAGRARVCKMEAFANRDVLLKYPIEAVPTVLVFCAGTLTHKLRGLRREQEYRDALNACRTCNAGN